MANQAAGPVKLFVLGDARIETPKGVIEPTAELVFAAALYFLLNNGKPILRRALERVLWPDVDSASASHRLRQTLLKLKQCGVPIAAGGKATLHIRADSVRNDFVALCTGHLPTSQDIPNDVRILPGYEPTFSEPFADWLDTQRKAMGEILSACLLQLVHRHRSLGEWNDVERAAGAAKAVSPSNEEASLALAEAFAMRGSKLEAIAILDSYLHEFGSANGDLRVQATLLRKRIGNRHAASERPSAEASLVGRSSTLGELTEELSAAKNSSGRASLVIGEAGIGKSRLLHELSGFAILQGFTVQKIQCRSSHRSRPLSAFVELVPALRNMRGAIGCAPETLADLDRLTQHRPIGALSRLQDTDSQWVYRRILRALFDIVDAISEESPLFLQFEDVHWLDATSAEVLADMIDWSNTRRVFFGLTARQQPEAWLNEMPSAVRLTQLKPLDEPHSEALLVDLSARLGRTMPADWLSWCVRVAEGNPYFLQELATHWVETNSSYELPPSLLALLGSRVDRLDRDSLQVLQTCALLENNSSLERLEMALGYEAHRLFRSIDSLGTAGMLVVEPDGQKSTKGRIASRHELLSNVAVGRLSIPAKTFLHRRIGQILEREVDEHVSTSILWDCAKHWQLAGDSERALSLGLSCARHLLEVGLSKPAVEAFERCAPFCSSDRQLLDVLEGEALGHYRVSDWQRVREVVALARALKDRTAPELTRHDDLELMDLRADWQSLQWDAIAARALECLRSEAADANHRVEAGIMAMMLLGYQGNEADVTTAYGEIERLIRLHGLGSVLDNQSQMVYHTGCGDLTIGVRAARQLIADQQEGGNIADIFRTYCNAAVTFRVGGLFEDAENCLKQALNLAERYDLDQSIIRVLPLLANMALERGLIEEARDWHSRLAALAVHPSNRFGRLELGGIGARIALVDNDGHSALRAWSLTRRHAQDDPIYHRRTYNCAIQVAIDLAIEGKANKETLDCLLDAYSHSKTGMHQAFGVCVINAALTRQGQKTKAQRIFHAYETTHRREPWPVPSHLVKGTLALGQSLTS